MILANELTTLDSEIASLQALIEAKRQQQEILSSAESLANEALARLTQALYKIEEVAPGAIASLKSAVLGLFADDDGDRNDDSGNQPTDPKPDTDPTPPLEFEISAVDGNGEEIRDGDRVQILNGGLNSGDINTAKVVGNNYLEVNIDNPSDPNQDTAGITYKHSQDVVKVENTDTLFTPGTVIVDCFKSFGIVIGHNNLGMSIDWLGLGEVPNPASGKGIWYDWQKDEQAIASLKPATHEHIKLLTTEEFLQFQGWEKDQLDEHWDNEWFEAGIGSQCKWGGATINRWIVVVAESCDWASPLASPIACLLGEDAPLLSQACAIETLPYMELVKVSDHIAYQRKHDGEIICAYFGFRTKALAQSWLQFFETLSSSVEMRQAKRLEGWKWEIKVKGLSIAQIERFKSDCVFGKPYRSEIGSAMPPKVEVVLPEDKIREGQRFRAKNIEGELIITTGLGSDRTFFCKHAGHGQRHLLKLDDVVEFLENHPAPDIAVGSSVRVVNWEGHDCDRSGGDIVKILKIEDGLYQIDRKNRYGINTWLRPTSIALIEETPAQAAGLEPPIGWGKPEIKPAQAFNIGDLIDWKGAKFRVGIISTSTDRLYCTLPGDPEGTKPHTVVPVSECALIKSAEQLAIA